MAAVMAATPISAASAIKPGRDWAVNVSVYDTVSGFGGMLNDNLAGLPTQFRSSRNPLSGDIGGCVFGQTGGFCFNNALQTASSAAFRQRGVTASFSGTMAAGTAALRLAITAANSSHRRLARRRRLTV